MLVITNFRSNTVGCYFNITGRKFSLNLFHLMITSNFGTPHSLQALKIERDAANAAAATANPRIGFAICAVPTLAARLISTRHHAHLKT
jgi:hypothetical protein